MLREGHVPWAWGNYAWYARGESVQGEMHEIEHFRSQETNGTRVYWYSEEELLRDYCKFYKLIPTEVTTHDD